MPILQNARHEAFAQARARGVLLDDAYEDAGFTPAKGNASRLSHRPEVAERIAELRAEATDIADASRRGMIAALLRVAKASEALATAAGVKEARITLLEARRIADDIERERKMDRYYWEQLASRHEL